MFHVNVISFDSVDSLLQIHAIHNLLLVDASIGDAERYTFEADLNKLEMKYLEKYVNNVKNFQIEQTKSEEKIDELYDKLQLNEYQWWINALKYNERDSDALLRKIQIDIKNIYDFEDMQYVCCRLLSILFKLTESELNCIFVWFSTQIPISTGFTRLMA